LPQYSSFTNYRYLRNEKWLGMQSNRQETEKPTGKTGRLFNYTCHFDSPSFHIYQWTGCFVPPGYPDFTFSVTN
jgi:hypothetical protein